MGGAAGGEVASSLAVDTIHDSYFRAVAQHDHTAALRGAIEQANSVIHRRAREDPSLAGMGTTCTAAAVVETKLIVGHVGDSRAYLARNAKLVQLTRDHCLATERGRQGIDRAGKAAGNILTRCLGIAAEVEVDVTAEAIPLQQENVIVLCSDGLSKIVQPDEILNAVSMHLPDVACGRLVELARKRGGPDNITVEVIRLRQAGSDA
jgi:protein phosphatase